MVASVRTVHFLVNLSYYNSGLQLIARPSPHIVVCRGRRRGDKSQLADFIAQERFPEQRRGGGGRGSRGGRGGWDGRGGEFNSRGRGGRGGGRRGAPRQYTSRTPPGPPPERWVQRAADERASYSDYRDRRRPRYEEAESGSESFARDSSPNDPERYRPIRNERPHRPTDDDDDVRHERQYERSNEREPPTRGRGRSSAGRGNYVDARGDRRRQQERAPRNDERQDTRHMTTSSTSQDARFQQDYKLRPSQQRQPPPQQQSQRYGSDTALFFFVVLSIVFRVLSSKN